MNYENWRHRSSTDNPSIFNINPIMTEHTNTDTRETALAAMSMVITFTSALTFLIALDGLTATQLIPNPTSVIPAESTESLDHTAVLRTAAQMTGFMFYHVLFNDMAAYMIGKPVPQILIRTRQTKSKRELAES